MIGQQGIGSLLPQPSKSRDLIRQHLQRQPSVLFRVIYMPDLQPPVVIMLDQMVVRIARKGQGDSARAYLSGPPPTPPALPGSPQDAAGHGE